MILELMGCVCASLNGWPGNQGTSSAADVRRQRHYELRVFADEIPAEQLGTWQAGKTANEHSGSRTGTLHSHAMSRALFTCCSVWAEGPACPALF